MKIVHAQTVLAEEQLQELKKKCNSSSTKEALTIAVEHYLECEYTDMNEDMWAKKDGEDRSEKERTSKLNTNHNPLQYTFYSLHDVPYPQIM